MKTIILLLIISVIGPILGAALGIIHYPSKRFMFNILAFAAGVMLAISFFNLIPQSILFSSTIIAAIGVAIGALLMYIIDKIVPHVHPEMNIDKTKDKNFCNINKSSRYINTALFIHNLPEGMVIALGTITNNIMGIIIAIAITIQKIPEGICTAAPTYYCNKNRFKSFLIACSTLAPLLIGFFIAYFLYRNLSQTIIGLIVGVTAGFMIYISTDELIPASSKVVTHQSTIISLIIGVLFVLILNMFVA
ncbi:MAG: ZIP family metal transporter [Candidatus Pacearchaeota archaeon]|nr:ZIP family metal transporter [Candidatus Pacearchaeota archaeon]